MITWHVWYISPTPQYFTYKFHLMMFAQYYGVIKGGNLNCNLGYSQINECSVSDNILKTWIW